MRQAESIANPEVSGKAGAVQFDREARLSLGTAQNTDGTMIQPDESLLPIGGIVVRLHGEKAHEIAIAKRGGPA